MIDVIICALVGFVGFFSSYGVWVAVIEARIVRRGPPKRSARTRERTVVRRTARVARPRVLKGSA